MLGTIDQKEVTMKMSKTAAMQQAIQESGLSRWGDGWMMTAWNERAQAVREYQYPSDYWQQREHLTEWRAVRTLELMGYGEDAVMGLRQEGTLRERVDAALRRLQ